MRRLRSKASRSGCGRLSGRSLRSACTFAKTAGLRSFDFTRAAACGGFTTSGCELRASAAGGCDPPIPAGSKLRRTRRQRTTAYGRLRPADGCAIETAPHETAASRTMLRPARSPAKSITHVRISPFKNTTTAAVRRPQRLSVSMQSARYRLNARFSSSICSCEVPSGVKPIDLAVR